MTILYLFLSILILRLEMSGDWSSLGSVGWIIPSLIGSDCSSVVGSSVGRRTVDVETQIGALRWPMLLDQPPMTCTWKVFLWLHSMLGQPKSMACKEAADDLHVLAGCSPESAEAVLRMNAAADAYHFRANWGGSRARPAQRCALNF